MSPGRSPPDFRTLPTDRGHRGMNSNASDTFAPIGCRDPIARATAPKFGGAGMGFDLPNFLRRTPPTVLQDYFADRGFSGPSSINWEGRPQLLLDRLLEAIEALPEQEREHVFDDFERAMQLCDEIGQRALQSVLAHDLLEAVRASDSHETRSLLVLLRDPHAFDHALATAYADDFVTGGVGADSCCPHASRRSLIKPDWLR